MRGSGERGRVRGVGGEGNTQRGARHERITRERGESVSRCCSWVLLLLLGECAAKDEEGKRAGWLARGEGSGPRGTRRACVRLLLLL